MRAMLVTSGTIILVAAIAITAGFISKPEPIPIPRGNGAEHTVAENSHYLDNTGTNAPTLVEFLDFECEACGALYPYVEKIRERYNGRINYVVRYFPLDGHFNSMNAALAVESAAQQGKYEEMFHLMFETQTEWGERRQSETERFRGFAESIGLDLAAYDMSIADPATRLRVEEDYNAGIKLGVSGTPTFFIDGELLELTGPNDLPDALDQALTG